MLCCAVLCPPAVLCLGHCVVCCAFLHVFACSAWSYLNSSFLRPVCLVRQEQKQRAITEQALVVLSGHASHRAIVQQVVPDSHLHSLGALPMGRHSVPHLRLHSMGPLPMVQRSMPDLQQHNLGSLPTGQQSVPDFSLPSFEAAQGEAGGAAVLRRGAGSWGVEQEGGNLGAGRQEGKGLGGVQGNGGDGGGPTLQVNAALSPSRGGAFLPPLAVPASPDTSLKWAAEGPVCLPAMGACWLPRPRAKQPQT